MSSYKQVTHWTYTFTIPIVKKKKKSPNITNSVMHSHDKHACTVWILSNPSAILAKMSHRNGTVKVSGSHHSMEI